MNTIELDIAKEHEEFIPLYHRFLEAWKPSQHWLKSSLDDQIRALQAAQVVTRVYAFQGFALDRELQRFDKGLRTVALEFAVNWGLLERIEWKGKPAWRRPTVPQEKSA